MPRLSLCYCLYNVGRAQVSLLAYRTHFPWTPEKVDPGDIQGTHLKSSFPMRTSQCPSLSSSQQKSEILLQWDCQNTLSGADPHFCCSALQSQAWEHRMGGIFVKNLQKHIILDKYAYAEVSFQGKVCVSSRILPDRGWGVGVGG